MPVSLRSMNRGIVLLFVSSIFAAQSARADIYAWYKLTSASGEGTGIAHVTQGEHGAPLIIEMEPGSAPIVATIRFVADIPADEEIIAYANDLIAPDSDRVAVNTLTFLSELDYSNVNGLNAGPGWIVDDAFQLSLFSTISGQLDLYELELEITPPLDGEVQLFSGIGSAEWAAPVEIPPIIHYADSDPLLGNSGEVYVSNTPSIIIRMHAPDCDGNLVADADEITPYPPLDCNQNGTLDSCELLAGTALDCNHNGKPDSCDIAANVSLDLNSNAIPDECEEAPPVNPIPPVDSPSANEQTPTATATETSSTSNDSSQPAPTGPLINRTDLANFLRFLFMLPEDGGSLTPMAKATLDTFGFLGLTVAQVQATFELLSLPERIIIYEFVYGVLNIVLP
jgi:hypothetical protein